MDSRKRLENLKGKILTKIGEAAKKGATEEISSSTRIIEEIERLIKRWEEINSAVDLLEKKVNSPINMDHIITTPMENILTSNKLEGLSPKKKGKVYRNEIIRELKTRGISLFHVEGTTYKTKNGSLVGIAYASERLPNRWFLGLPSKDYNSAILICENKNGKFLNFILSEDFLRKHIKKLSHDDYGQIKFNIFLKDEHYQLRIPGEGYDNIDNFQNNYSSLG